MALKLLDKLCSAFEKLPGVGKKTALRYAFYVVDHFDETDTAEFVEALSEISLKVKHCQVCNLLTEEDTCEICNNSLRDHSQIMVVKDTRDVVSIEKTHQFNGTYHVLGGLISMISGIGPDDLAIASLEERAKDPLVQEIILATNFSQEGDLTAKYLQAILKRDGLNITRIGFGLPVGSDIEYADEMTLKKALENRRPDI